MSFQSSIVVTQNSTGQVMISGKAGSPPDLRCLHQQISSYIEIYLSPYLCGYRKGYCAQYAIITRLEKWKTALDEKGYSGAILMDLSNIKP